MSYTKAELIEMDRQRALAAEIFKDAPIIPQEQLASLLKRDPEHPLYSRVRELEKECDQLRAELAAAREELSKAHSSGEDNPWYKSAQEFSNGLEYYRNIVSQIGEMLGDEAKTCDDGTKVPDVLCAKVAEAVQKRLAPKPAPRCPRCGSETIGVLVFRTLPTPYCWGCSHKGDPKDSLDAALDAWRTEGGAK